MVIETLVNSYNKHGAPYPIYFYCARDQAERERSELGQIVRCLLRQSLELPGTSLQLDALKKRYEKRQTAGELSLEEAKDLLRQSIEIRSTTYILVDALDECDIDNRRKLIECLREVLKVSSTTVKIFLASRKNPDIYKTLGQYPEVQLNAKQNQVDVDAYVEAKVHEDFDKGLLLPDEDKEAVKQELTDIKRRLREGANGM
jgi:hypothetical protein